ncbi:arylamine N-acetyltransferase family protein [Aquisediminimonas profunda]|uniref:arylamine N-acetyltransferase family protein n=1 Tax=Aquisediminimonas profunda TaxID=1550733 RepID=UPI001C62FCC7|nr:arylamine N-acetyltransferase [Aquisediminimonas profunda]
MTELPDYFERIGYTGQNAPSLATLEGVFRSHIGAIPFENLDVQLGRPVSLDLAAIRKKLIAERRGGWCFEQNGLLGWALAQMGFTVRRVSGGVLRSMNGDAALGNHLALIVTIDRPYLVDAGFGGSLAAPIPLAEGSHDHEPFKLTLTKLDGGFWRFEEQLGDAPFNFDFRDEPADEDLFARQCAWLQTDPGSPFVNNLVAQRRVGALHRVLRGRVFSTAGPEGQTSQVLDDADALVSVLRDHFALNVPEITQLWPAICARHQEVTASRS